MNYTVTTESGSVYRLDSKEMTWQRLAVGDKRKTSRDSAGNLLYFPRIEIGKPLIMEDDNILPGHYRHLVHTTLVTDIVVEGVPS